jgi:uncharacterized membrane protein
MKKKHESGELLVERLTATLIGFSILIILIAIVFGLVGLTLIEWTTVIFSFVIALFAILQGVSAFRQYQLQEREIG